MVINVAGVEMGLRVVVTATDGGLPFAPVCLIIPCIPESLLRTPNHGHDGNAPYSRLPD